MFQAAYQAAGWVGSVALVLLPTTGGGQVPLEESLEQSKGVQEVRLDRVQFTPGTSYMVRRKQVDHSSPGAQVSAFMLS